MKQESKKATLSALLTGFGDVIGLPITILDNLTSFLFIQILLVTAIAIKQKKSQKN